MGMSAAHQNFVSQTSNQAKALLDFFAEETQLDVLWSGTPDYQHTITQADIDSVESFAGAGLTVQNVTDAQYAMSVIKGNIQSAIVALTVLANLP